MRSSPYSGTVLYRIVLQNAVSMLSRLFLSVCEHATCLVCFFREGDYVVVEDGVPCGYPVHDASNFECSDGGPLEGLRQHLASHSTHYRFDLFSQHVPGPCPGWLMEKCLPVKECYAGGCGTDGSLRSDKWYTECPSASPQCDRFGFSPKPLDVCCMPFYILCACCMVPAESHTTCSGISVLTAAFQTLAAD